MPEAADEEVALVVTSPPYWQLKDYGTAGQLGYDQDYEDYLGGWSRSGRSACAPCVQVA